MPRASLRTPRLRLEPLGDHHLPYEIELDADPQVMRYLGNGHPRTAEQVRVQHGHRLAEGDDRLGFWVGLIDDEFVGWWILGRPGEGHADDEAELGYRLLPRWWRRGLATEGARELLRYGFDDLGLASVYAETMVVNTGSRATMATLGLHHVRTLHLEWDEPIPGYEHGEVEYAITRSEWDQLNTATGTASSPSER